MKKERFKIGDTIVVDHKLERVRVGSNRNWIPKKIKEMKVYVVGMRTLQNGKVDASDEGDFFDATIHFPAIMVTKGIHSKPFFVIHEKEEE